MAPTARAQRARDKKAISYCKNKMKGALPGIPGKASFIFNAKICGLVCRIFNILVERSVGILLPTHLHISLRSRINYCC